MSTDDAQGWRRDFRLLWGGSAFSHLGTVSAATASPLLALSLTGSPVFAGWVTAASAVPGLLLHVPAGWLADRADRRRIMQASQAARCLSTALFVLGFTLLGNPWLLLVAVLADGACATFYSIAESAAVRHIVPPGSRRSAIAKNEARLHIAQFLGRPLGGFLFGVGHLIPYIFDALSSFVSFRAIARMRTGDFHPFRMRRTVPEAAPAAPAAPTPAATELPRAKPVPAAASAPATPPHSMTAQIDTTQCRTAHAAGSPGADDDGWEGGWDGEGEGPRGATFRSGLALVARDPFLRTVLVVCGIANFVLQTTLLLMVVLAKDDGTSSAAIGFLLATSGVGGVLGALIAPRVLQRLSPASIVRACVWSWLVLLAVVAVAHDPVVGLVAWGSCSFMGAHVNVALAAHQASAVPKRLQGQVMGLTRFATGGAIPLGALCGGYVIAGLDPVLTAWLAVAVMALVVLGVSVPLAGPARRCVAAVRRCAAAVRRGRGRPRRPARTRRRRRASRFYAAFGAGVTITGRVWRWFIRDGRRRSRGGPCMASRSLDVADQDRLVSALLRIDSMRERRSRALYVSVLERELGHRLDRKEYAQDQHDVWDLVDCCLTHAGALHALVRVLEGFHKGSRSVAAVRAIVAELVPEPLLGAGERRELRQLVASLESQGLGAEHLAEHLALYRRAVGPVGPAPGRDVRGVQDLVDQLEDVASGSDGVPPLLAFAADLAGQMRGPTATALREWAIRFGERLGLPPERIEQLLQPAPPALPGADPEAFLVIECRPDGAEADRFLVTAWLQIAGERAIPLRREDEPRPIALLPDLIEELLARDSRVVTRDTPELTIELILPRSLLNLPFDQFRITIAGLERRLGIEYAVVLRSLERLRHRALRHNWRRAWDRLRQDPASATVCWVARPREYDSERLYTMVSEHPSVGLAMPFPPWGDGPETVDELWVAVHAGAPIVLWCRDGRDPERFAEEVRDLLGDGLLSLPRRVRDLRRKAVLDGAGTGTGIEPGGEGHVAPAALGDHLGLRLALLFDDPDRLPEPDGRLRPPAHS